MFDQGLNGELQVGVIFDILKHLLSVATMTNSYRVNKKCPLGDIAG